jgi:hypothetical protein
MKVFNAVEGGGLCRQKYLDANGPHAVFGAPIDTEHLRIKVVLPKATDAAVGAAVHKRITEALASAEDAVGGGGGTNFRDYLDRVFEHYRDTLKLPTPATRLNAPLANGGRLPIYVGLCDEPYTSDAFGNIVEGWIFISVKIGFEHPELRRVIIPHEMFHIFQGVDTTACGDNPDKEWPWDAAAVAVEDLIAPQVKRWSGKYAATAFFPAAGKALDPLDRCFRCPEEPLHTSYGGACKNRGAGAAAAYRGDYSKFILFKYLMRNTGLTLGSFWASYAAAGCDPKPVLEKDDYSKSLLADFQLALLADKKGAAKPAFDPADRALFRRAGLSVDLAASDPARYTYHLDPSLTYAKWEGQRVAPADVSSNGPLARLDSSALPLRPGATHRLLLETSPRASAAHETVSQLELIPEAQGLQAVASLAASLDEEAGGPGHVWDPDAPASWPASLVTNKLLGGTGPRVSSGDPVPRFIVVVLTNFGAAPVTYRLGLNHPAICETACGDFYQGYLLQKQCPQSWCASEAPEDVQSCISGYTQHLREMVDGLYLTPGYFCPFVCRGFPTGLDVPPPAATGEPDWGKRVCDEAGVGAQCSQTKMGLMPLHAWPKIACSDLVIP